MCCVRSPEPRRVEVLHDVWGHGWDRTGGLVGGAGVLVFIVAHLGVPRA